MTKIFLIGACLSILMIGCRTTKPETDNYLKAETDDSPSVQKQELVDVSEWIEIYVNKLIDAARKDSQPTSGWTDEAKEVFLRRVHSDIGGDSPGSGVTIAGVEVSTLSKIEVALETGLSADKKQLLQQTFIETIYGANAQDIGLIKGKVLSHKSMEFANHSIAPVMNVLGTVLGSDKIGHFFDQGYWYWVEKLDSLRLRCEYGQYMEGNPVLFEEKWDRYYAMAKKFVPGFRFGYFGSFSTGVISLADGEANEMGYQFYKRLFENPDARFAFKDFVASLPLMNEYNNPNKYANDIKVSLPPPPAIRLQDSCWRYDSNR